MSDLRIPDAVAERAAAALVGYPIADGDRYDAGCEVLQAAGPALIATALRHLANKLDIVKAEMRETDDRTIRSSGLGAGIAAIRSLADELDPTGGAA